jgi:hypothetical protein
MTDRSGGDEVLLVPVSAGELIDKITILQIKFDRIADEGKRANVKRELDALVAVRARHFAHVPELAALTERLRLVNERLWDIEDGIRAQEARQNFGSDFIALARSVYQSNDERARIKREINDLIGSQLVEEKSYV